MYSILGANRPLNPPNMRRNGFVSEYRRTGVRQYTSSPETDGAKGDSGAVSTGDANRKPVRDAMWVNYSSILILFAKYITQRPSRLAFPFLLSSPPRRSISLALAVHTATPHELTFLFLLTRATETFVPSSFPFRLDLLVSSPVVPRDWRLRSRFSRSIIFHNQSPTTAVPPTPIGDQVLLTVHHDGDYTLCSRSRTSPFYHHRHPKVS